MRNICKYIFILVLGTILSCSKEDYDSVNYNDTIEFIARPANFNDTEVTTKSEPTDAFETAIETLYLLIFDSNGNRVFFGGNEDGSLYQRVPKKGLTTVKACLIANVTREFAEGIESVSELESAVIENIAYATFSEVGGHFGVPKLTVNGQTKYCFPMVGCTTDYINIKDLVRVQIPLKRLFAKVSVNLQLNLNLSDWDNLVQIYTYFELQYYELRNLPTKVRLLESNDESAWIRDGESFVKTELGSGTINSKIYNTGSATNNNKSYEFYFYVPEYYLNPIELKEGDAGYQNQKYKPKNYSEGKLPVHLILHGNYSQYSFTSAELHYTIFLGGDTHSNYSLGRNMHYLNNITIIGIENNAKGEGDNLDWRVSTTMTNNPVAKEGRSANCYIITNTGDYSFPAYKGAYNDLAEALLCNNQTVEKLEIIANDNPSGIELDPVKLVYDKDKNIVSFNVSKIDDGNVVIALKNKNGSIEWSWHLWCSPNSQYDILGWGVMDNDTYGNNALVMDRNLGASSATITLVNQNDAIGPYYRYGYRDPYFANALNNNEYAYHGDNQSNYADWANSAGKSITDPCPPGYRVPSAEVWNNFTLTKTHDVVRGAFLLYESVYYPYSGYVDEKGVKQSGSIGGKTPKTLNEEIKNPLNQDLSYTIWSQPSTPPVKYTSISYNLVDTEKAGILSTCSNKVIDYRYKENGYELTSCKRITGKWKGVRVPFVGTYYVADYSDSKSNTETILNETQMKERYNDDYERIMTGISLINGFSGGLDEIFNKEVVYTTPNINTQYGYQVRCVSEESTVK